MGKRTKHFESIEKAKERLTDVPTELMKRELSLGCLTKEGAIARRELIAERERADKQDGNSKDTNSREV